MIKEYNKCFGTFSQSNNQTDTEYNIEVIGNKVYLKLQGSGSTEDWIQNFNFFAQLRFHFLHGRLIKPFKTFFFTHRGIYGKWASIRQNVHGWIDPLLKQGYQLYIHGFSQGGGLTQIAHEDFYYYLLENKLDTELVKSWAFASPMVFSILSSKAFRSRFKNLTVILNRNDLVGKVPGWLLGFRHYGKIIKIGKYNFSVFLPWKWIGNHLGYKKKLE